VDRHRFDANPDPDQTFYFDAYLDPDPDPLFKKLLFIAVLVNFILSFSSASQVS
jgi:hypothetical protein